MISCWLGFVVVGYSLFVVVSCWLLVVDLLLVVVCVCLSLCVVGCSLFVVVLCFLFVCCLLVVGWLVLVVR